MCAEWTPIQAVALQCNICRQTFLCTAQLKLLQDHAANKHSKQTFEVNMLPRPEA